MGLLFAALQLAITLVTLACATATRPDRTYHPMVRVIWAVLAFIYGGSFVGNLTSHAGSPNPVTRLAFNAAMLGTVLYALWFMRRRNHTPRFLELNLGGDIIVTSVEDLDRAAMLTESWLHHGAMPDAAVRR